MSTKKKTVILFAMIAVIMTVLILMQVNYYITLRDKRLKEDYYKLRQVKATAYINLKHDPEFINTATSDQPMALPESYYPAAESALGYGPVRVYITVDDSVIAYFGEPTYTEAYYADQIGGHYERNTRLWPWER